MTTKKFFLFIFFIGAAILLSVPFWPDQNLHLIFCDVGQGDGILVKYKEMQALIDGGPSQKAMAQCLSDHIPPGDQEIELMVLTHPDADHLIGLIDVIERYHVRQIVINSVIKESATFGEFHRLASSEGAEIYSPQAGDQLKMGPINFSVVWPKIRQGDERIWQLASLDKADKVILGAATTSGKTNENSIVLTLSYGNFDALLTGDITSDIEGLIDFPEVEVLKIPHHGSKYSTSDDLLNETSPDLAVISVGKNSFGHPTSEVLDRLTTRGISLLRTDQAGEIELVTDGQTWRID